MNKITINHTDQIEKKNEILSYENGVPMQIGLEQNNNKNTSRWHKIAYNWQLSCMGNKTKSHTD